MNEEANRYRTELGRVDTRLADLAIQEAELEESVVSIRSDLDNTVEEYLATVRNLDGSAKSSEDFYQWRHRAKWALKHKERALQGVRERKREANVQRTRIAMLLKAAEADYLGSDPSELLRASYHLLMDIIERVKYRLEGDELGLVAAIRLQSGYGVPGEKARPSDEQS